MNRRAGCWRGLLLTVLLWGAMLCSAPAVERQQHIEAEIGLGYDSNAFLSPSNAYFDPFDDPIVNPDRMSGFFIPLKLKGEYLLGPERVQWLSRLNFRGDTYLQNDLNNADNYRTRLDSGLEFLLRRRGNARDRFYIGPSLAYNKQVYFDRDTGLERSTRTTAESLADRYQYFRYGLESRLRVRTTPVRFALSAKIRRYDYEEVSLLSSLDYDYYRLRAVAGYDILQDTTVKLSGDYYQRHYRDRPARDLGGDLDKANPDLKYTYKAYGVTLRQKFGEFWILYLDYDRIDRDDEFVGYNDYTRHRYRSRLRYKDRLRRLLRLQLAWWERDYPRGLVFDRESGLIDGVQVFFPRKGYETLEGELRGELPISDIWYLWSGYEFVSQNSADPRYDYRRQQLSLGIGATF